MWVDIGDWTFLPIFLRSRLRLVAMKSWFNRPPCYWSLSGRDKSVETVASNLSKVNHYLCAVKLQVAQPFILLLAGHPSTNDMCDIPGFTERMVFMKHNVFGLLESFGATEENKKIIVDYFKAFHTPTMAEAQDFCMAYGVDYMIVDKDLFAE